MYLWEQERDRLSFTEGKIHSNYHFSYKHKIKGVLYNQFLTQNDFELVRQYAEVSHYNKVINYCQVPYRILEYSCGVTEPPEAWSLVKVDMKKLEDFGKEINKINTYIQLI